jgi:hypothetical protein
VPHKNWLAGDDVIASDFNPNVADQIVATFTTAAQRTSQWASPPTGAMSFLADTNTYWWWNGTTWAPFPGGALGSATGASNVAGASPSTATIITITTAALAAGRRIRIDYCSRAQLTTGAGVLAFWELVRDTTVLNSYSTYITPGGAGNVQPIMFSWVDNSPPAGSHSYLVRWATGVAAAGVDVASATQQRSLTLTDV